MPADHRPTRRPPTCPNEHDAATPSTRTPAQGHRRWLVVVAVDAPPAMSGEALAGLRRRADQLNPFAVKLARERHLAICLLLDAHCTRCAIAIATGNAQEAGLDPHTVLAGDPNSRRYEREWHPVDSPQRSV